MNVKSIDARTILDSRGDWTIEVLMETDKGVRVTASVPQGKSIGAHEAKCVTPQKAVKNIQSIIAPAVIAARPDSQRSFDDLLIKLDGTADKSKLGGNAMTGVSVAFAKVSAVVKQVPVWSFLREIAGYKGPVKKTPRLYMNLINGGLHAGNNLNIQEYLVIPKAKTFKKAVEDGLKINAALKKYVAKNFGGHAVNVGDEGGIAPDFTDDLEPLIVLSRVVKELDMARSVDFGIDAAASDLDLKREELFWLYHHMCKGFAMAYIEDPFGENDFENFALLSQKLDGKVTIVGDDLITTNINRMQKAYDKKSVEGIIIKPNQIGTLSETLDAVLLAKKYGWKIIASHRSGETNDDFIADLAYAVEADGIKLGAPVRGERIAKYNRLLDIERKTQ